MLLQQHTLDGAQISAKKWDTQEGLSYCQSSQEWLARYLVAKVRSLRSFRLQSCSKVCNQYQGQRQDRKSVLNCGLFLCLVGTDCAQLEVSRLECWLGSRRFPSTLASTAEQSASIVTMCETSLGVLQNSWQYAVRASCRRSHRTVHPAHRLACSSRAAQGQLRA